MSKTYPIDQTTMQYFDYETVAASQTDQVLGITGGKGDLLHRLIITVTTASTSAVTIKDGGGSAIAIMPSNVGSGKGVYSVEVNAASKVGAWSVTTSGGAIVLAVGQFTD